MSEIQSKNDPIFNQKQNYLHENTIDNSLEDIQDNSLCENNSFDLGSQISEEEYQKPFKNTINHEEQYEADLQQQTIYHHGDNVLRQKLLIFQNGKHMNEYEFLEKLGKGSFGKVKKVIRKYLDEDGVSVLKSFYAAKLNLKYAIFIICIKQIFNKSQLEYEKIEVYKSDGQSYMTNRMNLIYDELNIYKYLNHHNICKLYQIIDDDSDEKLYMIMEYCDLGQLMEWNEEIQQYDPNNKLDEFICKQNHIQETDQYKRRELQAKVIFKQLALGIKYLHSKNIINRDIKIDNILCKSNEEKGQNIKLADYSTAKQLETEGEKSRDCVGTSGFRCPQQQFNLDTGYDGKACDIWSLGISLITYINYKIPFWSDSCLQIDISAKNDPIKYEQHNSNQLKDIVESMCKKSEIDRITIDQVISHPFFNT